MLFAVGSLVRARVRPVAEVLSAEGFLPEFLPARAMEAARAGDLTTLLRMQGSFLIPKTFADELAPMLLSGQERALGAGSTAPQPLLEAASESGIDNTTSYGPDVRLKGDEIMSNKAVAISGSVEDVVEGVTLKEALALQSSGSVAVRSELHWDVTEVQILCNYGGLCPRTQIFIRLHLHPYNQNPSPSNVPLCFPFLCVSASGEFTWAWASSVSPNGLPAPVDPGGESAILVCRGR